MDHRGVEQGKDKLLRRYVDIKGATEQLLKIIGFAVKDEHKKIALFGYMKQMSFRFQRLVSTTQKALSKKDMLKDETTLSRMLNLLLASPFCQHGYEQWKPYVKLKTDKNGSKFVQLRSD